MNFIEESFNPLDRGNLYLIHLGEPKVNLLSQVSIP